MMKKYTCYIVDDEPLAIKVIEQHLSKFDQFQIIGTTTESVIAFQKIKELRPDLLFADIEMPDLNGLELIEILPPKTAVIITTAYREYAVEGFDLKVMDYLLKPISFKRFAQAISNFLEQFESTQSIENTTNHLFIKADRKNVKINFEDILYVEGVKDYVKIVLKNERILTKVSLGNFYKLLPKNQFLRPHKSFIVAKDKITAFTNYDVEIGDIEIPIGRIFKEVFLQNLS